MGAALDYDPEQLDAWLSENTAKLDEVVGTPAAVDLLREAVTSSPGGMIPDALFRPLFPFALDQFQLAALRALGSRESVIVSAPTGELRQTQSQPWSWS